MANTYTYKVRDRQGKLLEGALEADSTALVVSRLRQMGYTPIAIDAKDDAGLQKEIKLPFGGKPKLKDLAVFSRQFATMINSGLSLLRSLYILAEQTENKQLAGVVDQVRQDVAGGGAGLGLAIAQWIASVHGARIDVASQPGTGTRVSISFPLAAGA